MASHGLDRDYAVCYSLDVVNLAKITKNYERGGFMRKLLIVFALAVLAVLVFSSFVMAENQVGDIKVIAHRWVNDGEDLEVYLLATDLKPDTYTVNADFKGWHGITFLNFNDSFIVDSCNTQQIITIFFEDTSSIGSAQGEYTIEIEVSNLLCLYTTNYQVPEYDDSGSDEPIIIIGHEWGEINNIDVLTIDLLVVGLDPGTYDLDGIVISYDDHGFGVAEVHFSFIVPIGGSPIIVPVLFENTYSSWNLGGRYGVFMSITDGTNGWDLEIFLKGPC